MINCEKCGNQIKDNNKFCDKCGTPVSGGTSQPTKQVNVTEKKVEPKPKKELDKKTKTLGIIALIVLILGFSAYKVGEKATSRDKIVDKFIVTVTEQDVAGMAKIVKSSDPRLEVSEEALKPFVRYIEENPSYFDYLVESLYEEEEKKSESLKDLRKAKEAIGKIEDNNMISVKKKGKKFLLYDNYEVQIQPFFLRLETNYKGATIYVNDKQMGVSDSENFTKEYGPFLPGVYSIKSEYKGEYATINNERDVYLIAQYYDTYSRVSEYNLYLDGQYIYVDTNYYDGAVLVNGKDIGMTARDINNIGLGPVDDNTRLQLSMEFPWGTATSEEVLVGDGGSYAQLYISSDELKEMVKDDIMATINTMELSALESRNSKDETKLKNLVDTALKVKKELVQDIIDYETEYNGKIQYISYDLNTLEIYMDNGKYRSRITGKVGTELSYLAEDEEDVEVVEREDIYKYYLDYDENNKEWLVYEANRVYYFNTNNVKEFNY